MKAVSNQIMLITYADCMGKDLKDLYRILDSYFDGAIGGIHILPFFPSSGDRGFAPIRYDQVEPAFGDWEDIRRFSDRYYLMCDFMINHISVRSEQFQDYLEKKDASPYRDMFIRWKEFWPDGEPSEEDMKKLYVRKATGPVMECTFKDGSTERLWNTFWSEQVDLNPNSKVTQDYYRETLTHLSQYAPLIRLDALAYASKRPGTNCFFVEPEVWNVLDGVRDMLDGTGTEVLSEIHENYHIQQKMESHGYWVYDFALPMLVLHALKTGRTDRLAHWLEICPRRQFTTLDTHDGIGVVDVAGLLEEDEIDLVCSDIEKLNEEAFSYLPQRLNVTRGGKKVRYQMGGTFYEALGRNDDAYLLARLLQFYTPGIPQVYYVGMLAGCNDIPLLQKDPDPRNLNRHYYTEEEIVENLERPLLKRLLEVMRFRNEYPAFDGELSVVQNPEENTIVMTWKKDSLQTSLHANLKNFAYQITYLDPQTGDQKQL